MKIKDNTLPHRKNNKRQFVVHPNSQSVPAKEWFDPQHWANQGRLLGTYAGRGSVWMIKSDNGKWVLKHYYRGGLYAKISRDKYLWSGFDNTRAVREFNLLLHMEKLGLPCPKPVAVQVQRSGLFYTNDLITEYIQHQSTFADNLAESEPALWRRVGTVIGRFHAAGIYHADLNVHNLLIHQDSIHLIDFDKGEIKKNRKHWPQSNLSRLKRSIEKETDLRCEQDFKKHWQALLSGHQNALHNAEQ